jgi:hypothetical protein
LLIHESVDLRLGRGGEPGLALARLAASARSALPAGGNQLKYEGDNGHAAFIAVADGQTGAMEPNSVVPYRERH